MFISRRQNMVVNPGMAASGRPPLAYSSTLYSLGFIAGEVSQNLGSMMESASPTDAVALLAALPAVAFWEGARALAWQPVGLRVVSGEWFCQVVLLAKREVIESCFDIVHDTRLVSTITYTIPATGNNCMRTNFGSWDSISNCCLD